MKIVYFYNEEWEQEYVKSRLPDQEIVFKAGSISQYPDFRDDEAEVLCIFMNSHIGAPELERFPKLKFIATRSTGFDHIDLEATSAKGIKVSNVPSYGENTVAEFAFALLLCLSRKIYDSYTRMMEHGDFSQTGLKGFDLAGKTIGIIGTGRIGQHMIRMAKGFEMKVIAFDKFPNDLASRELGYDYVSLPELLGQSDIISLHAPLMPETEHMINLDNIGQIKKGAYLINTARGGLVDTSAIVKALEEGILAGAGLDVLEEEGYLADEMSLLTDSHPQAESLRTMLENHYLMNHPRVIMTPHNAFNTQEAQERIINTTIENTKDYTLGEIVNQVNK